MDRITHEMLQDASIGVLGFLEEYLSRLVVLPTVLEAFVFTRGVIKICDKASTLAFEKLTNQKEPDTNG